MLIHRVADFVKNYRKGCLYSLLFLFCAVFFSPLSPVFLKQYTERLFWIPSNMLLILIDFSCPAYKIILYS